MVVGHIHQAFVSDFGGNYNLSVELNYDYGHEKVRK